MSDVEEKGLAPSTAPEVMPGAVSTTTTGRAGAGPVMQTRLPRTTGQIASSPHRAPDPQADTATALGAELGLDTEEAPPVEAASAPPSAPPADDPYGLHLGAASDGGTLPSGLRSELEAATGASLGDVIINAGPSGARTADAHGARAVAEGHRIDFAAGEYRPDDHEGKKLIAHEVAHVAQQDVGPTEIAAKRGASFGDDRGAAEADADDFAVTFAEQGASTRWRPRATAAGPLLAPRDKETIDRDRRHFTEATRGNAPVTAAAYLQSFRTSLFHGIGQFLLTRRLTPGHADLRWIEGWHDFVAKLGQLLDVGDGRDVIMRLDACLAGNGRGSIYEIADGVRPKTDDGHRATSWVAELTGQPEPDDGNAYNDGPRGPRRWEPAVGIAVGEALEQVLAKIAMPPIAAQFIAHAERNRQLANERGEFPAEVRADELIPGHPLAWYVARAFAEPPASVEPAGGKLDADPDAVVAYKRVKEVRWLGPPAPWNAVQPVKPAKTSPEAMAARFLGAPTQAHRIKQVGDYYLIPEEVAATIPEAARNRPKRRKDAPPADDVHVLATSTLGDQAAAAEADVNGAKVPAAGELIALWTAIDKKLHGLMLATAKLPGQALVAGAAARHTAARLGLEALGPEEATTRAVVYRAQLELLTQIAEDVGALAMHIDQQAAADPWADKVSAGQKARLTALLRAASVSHVPETGKAALDEARALEQTQVLDTLEALFADAVARVEAARHVKDDAKTQSKRSAETFGATLPDRRDRIRMEMADLRTKLRQGTASPEAIQRLIAKVDGFRFEAMLVANYGAIQQVMVAAEKLEESDWVAAVGKIDNLEDVRGAGNRFRMGLSRILGRWLQANKDAQTRLAWIESKGGDPDLEAKAHALVDTTLAELRAKLAALGDDDGIQAFLRHAYDEIDDAQTKAAILQVATIIGVTIIAAVVSGGVGSAAGGAAAGLVGEGLLASSVGILAESATMSVATTLLNGGDFGEAFATDMAQNVAMLGALKGFDSVFRATRLGATVGRGAEGGKLGYYTAKGVELTGRSVVMAGVMLASAEVESLRKQGRTLSADEIQAQGAQGIAQVIGTAVLNRLAKTPMAQLKGLGVRGGALVKQHANLMALARQVKKSKANPALALDLLRQERAHLEAELALWTELSTKTPAELHRMGVEPEVVKAMIGSTAKHLGGLDQLEGGTLPAQLGLETVVPGRVYEGSEAQVAKVLGSYRKPGVTVESHPQADGGHRYRVVGPDGSPVELIARPAAPAAPGERSRAASSSTATAKPVVAPAGPASATDSPSPASVPTPKESSAGDVATVTSSLPALQSIEAVTGVNKGPAYEQGMADLRSFYANMETEAQRTNTSVRAKQTDGSYEWDYGHDAQTFSHGVANFEVRVHLKPAPGVGDAQLAHLRRQVHAGVDHHYNHKNLVVRGRDGVERRLHVEVTFVDSPGTAHIQVTAHPGNGYANVNEWFVEGNPTTHAHEVTHGGFGIKDEYVDWTGNAPDRYFPNSPGVHTDQSLMGDYWIGDAIRDNHADPATSVKPRHLDEIGGFVPPDAQARESRPPPARMESHENGSMRQYLAGLSRTGGVPPPAPGKLPDHTVAIGDFHGQAREGADLTLSTVRTHVVNDLALIAPPDTRMLDDHTLAIDGGERAVEISITVGKEVSDSVAGHERLPDGSFVVRLSPRARTADLTRALASELATIRGIINGTSNDSGPPRGLEGRAAELTVLLDNLDRSSARGGEHLDGKQVAKDLRDLFDALGIDASPAGRARLEAILSHDKPRLRRALMHLDGFQVRPRLDAASDLADFAATKEQHLDQLAKHVDGPGESALLAAEQLALGAQLRMEEGHRFFDQINRGLKAAQQAGKLDEFLAHQSAMIETLNNPELPLGRRQAVLAAQLSKLLADPEMSSVARFVDETKARAALEAIGPTDEAHGVMLLDPASGELSVAGKSRDADGPRSLRDLMGLVDGANRAATENGLAIEYVIIVHPPARRGDGGETSHVEVLARRRLRSRLPDRTSPGLPDSGGEGDLIVDVGVGRGSFAAELAARGDADTVVQTEHISLAHAGQASRGLAGIADAGPLVTPGAVMVYGDVLSRPDVLRGTDAEAGREGIRRMFLNNISAHFKEPDPTRPDVADDYTPRAMHLLENMADGGTVEVQWTDTPENAAGDPRGHIRGDLLARILEEHAAAMGRRITASAAEPVPYDYTINASRRGQAGADALAEFEAPVPKYRMIITFHGSPRSRSRSSAP